MAPIWGQTAPFKFCLCHFLAIFSQANNLILYAVVFPPLKSCNNYYCKPAMYQSLCINTFTALSRILPNSLQNKCCFQHLKNGMTVAQTVSELPTIIRLRVSAIIKKCNFKGTSFSYQKLDRQNNYSKMIVDIIRHVVFLSYLLMPSSHELIFVVMFQVAYTACVYPPSPAPLPTDLGKAGLMNSCSDHVSV